jgi:hypothetical protein
MAVWIGLNLAFLAWQIYATRPTPIRKNAAVGRGYPRRS